MISSLFQFNGPLEVLAAAAAADAAFDQADLRGEDAFAAHRNSRLGLTMIAYARNESAPGDPDPLLRGQEAQSRGYYKEALKQYQRAMTGADEWRRLTAHYFYAAALFRDGRAPEHGESSLRQLKILEKELAERPPDDSLRVLQSLVDYYIGMVLSRLEREEASVYFPRAIERLKNLLPDGRILPEELARIGSMLGADILIKDKETGKMVRPTAPSSGEPVVQTPALALAAWAKSCLMAGLWIQELYEYAGQGIAFQLAQSGALEAFKDAHNDRALAKTEFEMGIWFHFQGHFRAASDHYKGSLQALKKFEGPSGRAGEPGYEVTNWIPLISLLTDLCEMAEDGPDRLTPELRDTMISLLLREIPYGLNLAMALDLVLAVGEMLLRLDHLGPAYDAFDLSKRMLDDWAMEAAMAVVGVSGISREEALRRLLAGEMVGFDYYYRRLFHISRNYGLIRTKWLDSDPSLAATDGPEILRRFYTAVFCWLRLSSRALPKGDPAREELGRMWLRSHEVNAEKPDFLAVAAAAGKMTEAVERLVPGAANIRQDPEIRELFERIDEIRRKHPSIFPQP